MRKIFILPLILASFFPAIAGNAEENAEKSVKNIEQEVQKRVSYKLEDLCDTEIKERDLRLNVYILPSEKLWDYHDYKDELFNYVREFFSEQKINLSVNYSKNKLNAFNSANEVGIEIFDSDDLLEKRYFELCPSDEEEEIKMKRKLMNQVAFSVTELGIVLMNGRWDYDEFSREDREWFLNEEYKGRKIKEHTLRYNAMHLSHEVLHCLSLFHPKGKIFPMTYNELPNIMTNLPPNFNYKIGYFLDDLQRKMLHSYLAKNNTYKAFLDSGKDLETFSRNIIEVNKLGLK